MVCLFVLRRLQVRGTVPSTVVEVENVCCPDGVDRDIRCEVSAATLEEACAAEKVALRQLCSDLLFQGDALGIPVSALRSVELIVRA